MRIKSARWCTFLMLAFFRINLLALALGFHSQAFSANSLSKAQELCSSLMSVCAKAACSISSPGMIAVLQTVKNKLGPSIEASQKKLKADIDAASKDLEAMRSDNTDQSIADAQARLREIDGMIDIISGSDVFRDIVDPIFYKEGQSKGNRLNDRNNLAREIKKLEKYKATNDQKISDGAQKLLELQKALVNLGQHNAIFEGLIEIAQAAQELASNKYATVKLSREFLLSPEFESIFIEQSPSLVPGISIALKSGSARFPIFLVPVRNGDSNVNDFALGTVNGFVDRNGLEPSDPRFPALKRFFQGTLVEFTGTEVFDGFRDNLLILGSPGKGTFTFRTNADGKVIKLDRWFKEAVIGLIQSGQPIELVGPVPKT